MWSDQRRARRRRTVDELKPAHLKRVAGYIIGTDRPVL